MSRWVIGCCQSVVCSGVNIVVCTVGVVCRAMCSMEVGVGGDGHWK